MKPAPEVERYKDLAYSFKDLSGEERQIRQKLLRILREQEKRIRKLETKMDTILTTLPPQSTGQKGL
jgi:hypothetical protein